MFILLPHHLLNPCQTSFTRYSPPPLGLVPHLRRHGPCLLPILVTRQSSHSSRLLPPRPRCLDPLRLPPLLLPNTSPRRRNPPKPDSLWCLWCRHLKTSPPVKFTKQRRGCGGRGGWARRARRGAAAQRRAAAAAVAGRLHSVRVVGGRIQANFYPTGLRPPAGGDGLCEMSCTFPLTWRPVSSS